ncbi:hypothetical protein FKM82_011603 [Ascaphus truei]
MEGEVRQMQLSAAKCFRISILCCSPDLLCIQHVMLQTKTQSLYKMTMLRCITMLSIYTFPLPHCCFSTQNITQLNPTLNILQAVYVNFVWCPLTPPVPDGPSISPQALKELTHLVCGFGVDGHL